MNNNNKKSGKRNKCVNAEDFNNKGFWFQNSADPFFPDAEVVTLYRIAKYSLSITRPGYDFGV